MSDSNKNKKKELIEIVNGLPPTKIVQVLEFAKSLQAASTPSRRERVGAARRIRGKYKDVLSSSDEFARRRDEERRMEDR